MISNPYHTGELDWVLWKLRHEPADLLGHLQRAAGFLGAKRAFERAARRPPAEPGYAVHYGMHFTDGNAGNMALHAAMGALLTISRSDSRGSNCCFLKASSRRQAPYSNRSLTLSAALHGASNHDLACN